jgi:hypothetical protein
MKAVCPACSCAASIEAFLNDADARAAIAIAARLPSELGPLALRYIALFRPAKRQLSWPRVRKLLGELAAMIEAGSVEHYGRPYPVSHTVWAQAMTAVLNAATLTLPLTGHGYLVKILVGESPRAAAAAEEAEEARKRRESAGRSKGQRLAQIEIDTQRQVYQRMGQAIPQAVIEQINRKHGVES